MIELACAERLYSPRQDDYISPPNLSSDSVKAGNSQDDSVSGYSSDGESRDSKHGETLADA